jgi:hypothetical protein
LGGASELDLPGENFLEARVHFFQVSGVASRQFDGGRSLIADVGERRVDGAPIDLAFQQRRELGQPLLEREILDVDFDDALAERADPILRVGLDRDVADIEIGADTAVDSSRSARIPAGWEACSTPPIPMMTWLRGERNQFADLPLRPTPGRTKSRD